MTAKETLLALSLKYNGDFNSIMKAIKSKECLSQEELNQLVSNFKGNYFTILDKGIYPSKLLEIYKPPVVIFYEGNIDLLAEDKKRVGFVGSRYAYTETEEDITAAAKYISDNDVVVVSGLAKGIDSAAALGAIENNKIIGVIGTGIDKVYPEENDELQASVAAKGLLLSEYPPGVEPEPKHFPARNRIVVGISDCVVVGECREKSGTMISVNLACVENRSLAVFPTKPHDGDLVNNKIIQAGAYLVEDGKDILFLVK